MSMVFWGCVKDVLTFLLVHIDTWGHIGRLIDSIRRGLGWLSIGYPIDSQSFP